MRRINYTIIFLFTLIFSLGSYGSDYCLFKEITYENNFSIKVFILSKECRFDNNSDSVVQLFNSDKVIKESKYILPKIDVNKDYIFEGERDLRVNAGYLELEIAKPSRAMSDAYSFIFKFKINKKFHFLIMKYQIFVIFQMKVYVLDKIKSERIRYFMKLLEIN